MCETFSGVSATSSINYTFGMNAGQHICVQCVLKEGCEWGPAGLGHQIWYQERGHGLLTPSQPQWLHCTVLCFKMDVIDDSSGSGQWLLLTIYINQVCWVKPEVLTPSKDGCSKGWSQGVGGRIQLRLDEVGGEEDYPHKLGCLLLGFFLFWAVSFLANKRVLGSLKGLEWFLVPGASGRGRGIQGVYGAQCRQQGEGK